MSEPIDYYGISTEVISLLQNNSTLEGLTVENEPEFMLGAMDQSPILSVYMIRRSQDPMEPIAGGRRLRYNIEIALWLWLTGLEVDVLLKDRSAWLWKIEAALLANRTLNGKVTTLWITGGDLATERSKERFMLGAETVLNVVVDAST